MHKLERGNAPTCLAKYRHGTHNWDSLDAMDKSQVQATLHEMQGNRCAYCESALRNDKSFIEHFAPRAMFPMETFRWENLFLSCDGDKHCGRHKKAPGPDTYDMAALIKPDADEPDDYLRFYASGKVSPRSDLNVAYQNRAEVTIRVLNLNAVKLREKRRRAVESFRAITRAIMEELEQLDDEFHQEWIQHEVTATSGQPHCTAIRHFLSP